MDAAVWGPPYWFFLHTVAHTYPEVPNAVTKRKYYDLIQNMPLFLPDAEIGNRFSGMLDAYPVSPYLDSRDSFVRWVHFVHNKVNQRVGKREVSLAEGIALYLDHYKPKEVRLTDEWRVRQAWLTAGLTGVAMTIIILLTRYS